MQTIATLSPSIRLVIFRFLMKSALVPDFVPRLPVQSSTATPTIRGVEVLPSTPNVCFMNLFEGLFKPKSKYEWRGARVAGERVSKTQMIHGKLVEIMTSDVRFTFCHRRHLNQDPPHRDFVTRHDQLFNFLTRTIAGNLWSVQAYLNPYFQKDGAASNGNVLMFSCAGRRPVFNPDGSPVKIHYYEFERDKSPIGLVVVPLINTAKKLELIDKEVRLF